MAKQITKPKKAAQTQDFYEVMPYMPAYDSTSHNDMYALDDNDIGTPAGRLTAIITLVVLGVAVVALGFVAVRGFDMLQASTPTATSPDF